MGKGNIKVEEMENRETNNASIEESKKNRMEFRRNVAVIKEEINVLEEEPKEKAETIKKPRMKKDKFETSDWDQAMLDIPRYILKLEEMKKNGNLTKREIQDFTFSKYNYEY